MRVTTAIAVPDPEPPSRKRRRTERRVAPSGASAAPDPDTGTTLIESIRATLTAPQLALFDELLRQRGLDAVAIERGDLAAAVNWEPSGSNLRNCRRSYVLKNDKPRKNESLSAKRNRIIAEEHALLVRAFKLVRHSPKEKHLAETFLAAIRDLLRRTKTVMDSARQVISDSTTDQL